MREVDNHSINLFHLELKFQDLIQTRAAADDDDDAADDDDGKLSVTAAITIVLYFILTRFSFRCRVHSTIRPQCELAMCPTKTVLPKTRK